MAHHHLCQSCHLVKVPCDGTWERNHDGSPEVVCDLFHLSGGELNPECVCEGCRAKQDADYAAEADWRVGRHV